MEARSNGLQRLVEIMERLRSPEGCPWDRKQTLESLKSYLIEEAYETLEAIEAGNPNQHKEELGDVLFQIVFQCQIRREQEKFDIYDVIDAITEKITRRHPHVFGDRKVRDADQVVQVWEEIKREEKNERAGDGSPLDGVPASLPALLAAEKLSERAARVGFDWSDAGQVMEKVREELDELVDAMEQPAEAEDSVEHELGDLLFAVVNLARHLGLSAEDCLRKANARFRDRFEKLRKVARAHGVEIENASLETLEALWQQAKRTE